ncbi:MAG: alpha-L-fucosidase, partial [Gammaproteobacteria bacterium]
MDFIAGIGARYVVPVTKHDDSYCLWPTRFANPLATLHVLLSVLPGALRRAAVISAAAAACGTSHRAVRASRHAADQR